MNGKSRFHFACLTLILSMAVSSIASAQTKYEDDSGNFDSLRNLQGVLILSSGGCETAVNASNNQPIMTLCPLAASYYDFSNPRYRKTVDKKFYFEKPQFESTESTYFIN